LVFQLQQLETVKVGQVGANLALLELLGPSSLVPGSNSLVLLQSLDKGSLTNGTREVLEDKRSQDHTAEGESLTNDTGGGTIDESTVVINNIDDNSQLTGISTVVNENNTTNFDLTLESTLL
jgi:DNA/RNA endonuclease YhcR with UshA esterase domain